MLNQCLRIYAEREKDTHVGYIYIYIHIHMYTYIYIYIYTHVITHNTCRYCVHYVSVCIYIYICVCVCAHGSEIAGILETCNCFPDQQPKPEMLGKAMSVSKGPEKPNCRTLSPKL